MNRRLQVRRFGLRVLTFALLASGCAAPMQMSSEELKRLTPMEGVVVGSIRITGGRDVLGRKEWTLYAERLKGPLSSVVSPGLEYRLQASRGESEQVFVTKMEAGDYRFWKLSQEGFSTFTAKTNVHFKVQAGKSIYIGRLVVQFPPGFLGVGTTFRTVVEDARASTLEVARQTHGLSPDDVSTGLMTVSD